MQLFFSALKTTAICNVALTPTVTETIQLISSLWIGLFRGDLVPLLDSLSLDSNLRSHYYQPSICWMRNLTPSHFHLDLSRNSINCSMMLLNVIFPQPQLSPEAAAKTSLKLVEPILGVIHHELDKATLSLHALEGHYRQQQAQVRFREIDSGTPLSWMFHYITNNISSKTRRS